MTPTVARKWKSDYLVPIQEKIAALEASSNEGEDPAGLRNRVDLLKNMVQRLCEELIN